MNKNQQLIVDVILVNMYTHNEIGHFVQYTTNYTQIIWLEKTREIDKKFASRGLPG